MDYARCSVTVPGAREVLITKKLVEKNFKVVCVKNGYSSNIQAKGSGYRDIKLLVVVDFDNLKLDGVAKVEPTTKFVCEVQIVCEAWLENKKTTSLPYKILRAANLSVLLSDFSKYIKKKNEENSIQFP